MKTANKAKRVTHFIIGLLSFVTLICIGVDVRNSTVGFFVGILPSWLFITKMPHLISRTIHVCYTRDLVGDHESKTRKKIEYK